MLHHAVPTNQFQRDATCGNAWLGLAGERFFASGDERTSIACVGDPVATVKAGEIVRLHSEYQSSHAADDVMGIMLAYINRA